MRQKSLISISCYLVLVATGCCLIDTWAASPQSSKKTEEKARSLAAAANALYEKAQFKSAEPIVAELLDLLKQIPEYADNSVAQAIAHRADLYYYANDNKDCIPLYQQELKMRDAVHWERFTDRDEKFQISCERNRLAICYANLGDFRAAEPIYKRTLREFQAFSGSNKIDGTTVSVSAFYAQCLRHLGKTKEAELLEAEVNKYNNAHPVRDRD